MYVHMMYIGYIYIYNICNSLLMWQQDNAITESKDMAIDN